MKQLLHVGPGYSTKKDIIKFFNNEDWQETRVDINRDVNPDILGGMQDLSNVKKNYYDAIYSSHSIEHVYQYEVNGVLREFYKVLNDDGVAVITCPELKSVCKLILEDKILDTAYVSEAGPITPIDILYGHRDSIKKGNEFMAHKNGFTLKTLTKECHLAGFKSVAGIERPSYFDIWIVAQKNETNKHEFTAKIKKILEF
tara:strand:+ start:32 stop:631 length:600 start_codon:yes stop_codon:yes gene_type:complete